MFQHAFITVLRGQTSQLQYELDPSQPVRVGRGNGCQIYLADPLSSRTHVILSYEAGQWFASDADSRNGTLVNEQRIAQVALAEGDRIRIGSTELEFHLSDPSTPEDGSSPLLETLVLDAPVAGEGTGIIAMGQMFTKRRIHDLVDLFQLSLCLLRCKTPSDVAEFGLQIVRERTGSSVAGLMWLDEHGALKPFSIHPPEGAVNLRLSRKLNERVTQQVRAVWTKQERTSTDTSSSVTAGVVADAICVPIMRGAEVVGALHLYRDSGAFEQLNFDFAITAGTMLGAALETTRDREILRTEHRRLVERTAEISELLGDCPPMKLLKDRIHRVASASGCVLIRGESGVGKELVARAIHRHSPRSDRPLLCVNCAAIPADLMESQLFGHRKGAFTGAERDHLGWFQQAHTGTLFLDEVGELTLEGQAKLLRILENHPFMPVGSSQEIKVDVRVIAATNRDLREYVREKKFREDLYYRLSVFELLVPPLRERGQDIQDLLEHFLAHFRKQHGRPHIALSDAARKCLLEYAWPGNVRQLRNVIDSAVVLAAEDQIQPHDLPLRDVGTDRLDSLRIDVWEERLIREALQRTSDNVPEAAKLLGISRATLYRKLEQYQISR
jgi:two-component system, NtrC family, response regulator HydG